MVKEIIGGPGTGKTKELLEQAALEDATVVCKSPERMIDKAHAYGIAGLRIISYLDYIAELAQNLSTPVKYYVDELESFCLSTNIKAFTLVK